MTFVKEPALFPYCFVLTLFSFDHLLFPVAQGRTGPQSSAFYGSTLHQWFLLSVHLAIIELRWESHILPCVKRNPVRASSWEYSSHCCLDSCQLNDFAVFQINSTTQQTILTEGFITCVLCICTFTGAQSHPGTGLSWNMVCTLCMTPVITPLWPYSSKTADLYRCGFGPSFFWRQVVVNLGPYRTNHSLPSRAAKRKLKQCEDLLGGHAQGWISCCLNVILPKSLYV